MSIAAPGAKASVHVDYQNPAGYGNPFTVPAGGTKAVLKADLESEHVRVGARDAGITVTY